MRPRPVRRWPERTSSRQRQPLRSGDGPPNTTTTTTTTMASPHTRGSTVRTTTEDQRKRGHPAHAGIYLRLPSRRSGVYRESPPLLRERRTSPRTRGSTHIERVVQRVDQRHPARAGVYPVRSTRRAGENALPRERGMYGRRGSCRGSWATLAPHGRGCARADLAIGQEGKPSPARAGIFLHHPRQARCAREPPRTRGDTPRCRPAPAPVLPVPRARGDLPRPQITRITSENRVCWLFWMQIDADLSRNEPRGAGSAGSTAGSTRCRNRK